MKAKPRAILVVAITFSFALTATGYQAGPAYSWWQTGHTIVASRAIKFLPQPWANFFSYYELTVNETSVYPDSIYKELDPEEDPRHFIDLEVWSPDKPDTGTLASAVEQYTAEMSQAIGAGDWNQMFIAVGRVAHYVADIHQPYHATVNYNPRSKAGSRLHGLLDSSMEAHVSEFKLLQPGDVGRIQPVENVTAFMFYIARQSSSFLYTINHTLIDEGKSWSPELTRIIENRTNTAIVSLARVWYTAIGRSGAQPPQIPTPNRLSIAIETKPQQVDPDKSFGASFTVSDSLGIRAILEPKATVGDLKVSVHPAQGLEVPFGRYVAIIPPDTLKRHSGSSLTLNLIAERGGYEGSSAQLQIQVSQPQTVAPQPPSQPDTRVAIPLVVAVALLGAGLALVARRRSRKGRRESPRTTGNGGSSFPT